MLIALANHLWQSTLFVLVAALLALLWALGAGALLLHWWQGRRRLQRLMAEAEAGTAIRSQGRSIPVRHTRERIAPAMVGVQRPVLLLPRGLERRLDDEQLAGIVAHEISHWRHADNLTAAMHRVVATVFWFHPLVWWIGARLHDERERACDEAVVRAGHDPATYAEGLLRVCELCVGRTAPCAAGAGGANLAARVTSILGHRPVRQVHPIKRLLLITAALAALPGPLAAGYFASAASNATATPDREYTPVDQPAPVYPQEAVAEGREGHVTMAFTVTESGQVTDLRVVDSTDPIFEQPALDAVAQFRYEPRLVGGRPVAVPDVHFRITFQLD